MTRQSRPEVLSAPTPPAVALHPAVNPQPYDGIYTCVTYVFNLKRICNPAKSYRSSAVGSG